MIVKLFTLKIMKKIRLFPVLLPFATFPLLWLGSYLGCHDAAASDFHSPRTAALGGAGHAGPILNDAIVLNPSFGSFFPTYSFGVNYVSFSGPSFERNGDVIEPHGRNYSVSIQDGRTELFQAGVHYSQLEDGSVLHVGASKAFLKRMGFGIGAKFLFDNNRGSLGRDMTLSVSGLATPWFQTAFIVDNVFETEVGRARGHFREYVLGTKFNVMSALLLYFDPHLAPGLPEGESFGHEAGVEFVLMKDLFLRFGNFRNSAIPFQNTRGRGYGAGLGWIAPRFSLDYGMSRVIEPVASTSHTFGMTIFF